MRGGHASGLPHVCKNQVYILILVTMPKSDLQVPCPRTVGS